MWIQNQAQVPSPFATLSHVDGNTKPGGHKALPWMAEANTVSASQRWEFFSSEITRRQKYRTK